MFRGPEGISRLYLRSLQRWSTAQADFERRADPQNQQQQSLLSEMRAHLKKVVLRQSEPLRSIEVSVLLVDKSRVHKAWYLHTVTRTDAEGS